MLANLKFEWFLFSMHHGLLSDKAKWIAGYLPATFAVLMLLLAAAWLWLWRMDRPWAATLAGYAAICSSVLAVETWLLTPVVAWSLLGTPRPPVSWVLQTFPKECIAAAVGFPLLHGLAAFVYRPELEAWLARFRL
jgi:hypothetical protein